MQTSLRGIAEKAAKQKEYRFRNLFMMLTVENLLYCWKYINKKATPGVDRIDAQTYGENLLANITALIASVKSKSYRARLVLRKYIPKLNSKLRPLGIPSIADKLLQCAVSRILEAIYEQDFLPFSYGYRPMRSAHDALRELSEKLRSGIYLYVVEADIKGFFDNINHGLLLEMLKKRIDDKPFLNLIEKWLKAGILDTNGMVIDPATGTPQGGIVSPILANVYLHYALDVWFEEVVKPLCRGEVYLCRYADDFVCLFQYESDAQRYYEELHKRLETYGLELATEKTKIIPFSRYSKDINGKKPSFEFLSFEFRWGKNRWGKPMINRRTSRKKYKASIANFTKWIQENRNIRIGELLSTLKAKLRGYYNYYGLRCNSKSLADFYYQTNKILFKWLNRRSQRKSYNWDGFTKLLQDFKIPRPQICKNF